MLSLIAPENIRKPIGFLFFFVFFFFCLVVCFFLGGGGGGGWGGGGLGGWVWGSIEKNVGKKWVNFVYHEKLYLSEVSHRKSISMHCVLFYCLW